MKDPLQLSVKKFLESRLIPGQPVLLAYSGGPDSKTLLHLLCSLKDRLCLNLHVAHVDHSWRGGSASEAEALRAEVFQEGLPFHLLTLEPSQVPKSNMEAHARALRLSFFKKITLEIGSQALILAHQADDQAETVLKRIFEGAHLRHVCGMLPIGELEGMVVWRPLLHHPKQELLQWLGEKKLTAVVDETNQDPRFLRGRMRTQLLPFLNDVFGKQIQDHLCRLSRVAGDLSSYFSQKLSPCFKTLQHDSTGITWDLSQFVLEKIEWEYLLKEWLSREKLVLSRQLFERSVEALYTQKKQDVISLKQGVLCLNSGVLRFNYSR